MNPSPITYLKSEIFLNTGLMMKYMREILKKILHLLLILLLIYQNHLINHSRK